MRSFDATARWSPAGRRWIAQIPLPPAVVELGDAYLAAAARWRSDVDVVLRPVPRQFRHITLAWADVPAEDVPQARVAHLAERLAATAARHPPIELRFGTAIVNTVAIELDLAPSEELTRLREDLAIVIADELELPPEPQDKRWRAHTAIAYCCQDCDADGLQSALLRAPGPTAGYQPPVTVRVDRALLAATDPWSEPFWRSGVDLPLAT